MLLKHDSLNNELKHTAAEHPHGPAQLVSTSDELHEMLLLQEAVFAVIEIQRQTDETLEKSQTHASASEICMIDLSFTALPELE